MNRPVVLAEAHLIAEYDVEVPFSEEDAREEFDRASAFLSRSRAWLLTKGLTPNELGPEP